MTEERKRLDLPEFDEITQQKLLPKSELEHGKYYIGRCRNASVARWNGDEQCFYHWRVKFERVYIQTIKHPVDEERFDVFRPLRLWQEPKFEIPFDVEAAFPGNTDDLYEFNSEVWCSCGKGWPCSVHPRESR